MAKTSIQLLLILTIYQANFLLGGSAILQKDDSNKLSYRLPTNARPTSYDIHLEPDLQKFTFKGDVRIKFEVTNAINVLTLNAKNLTVAEKGVAVNDTNVGVAKIETDEEQEFLLIYFKNELKNGSAYELTVKYTGELNDQKRGFYRSRYFDEKGDVRYVAATHFEPTGARLAFPCFDEPGYKAKFTISLTHASSYTAISNVREDKGKSSEANGIKTTVFEETPEMSSYLVAFVVSDYGNQEEGNFRVWTKPHAVNQAAYALKVGQQLLSLLDNYMGINYTEYMPKMDQVSLKDFSAGAMENWGLVTYRESALLYEEGVTPTRTKQSVTTIIAHEFAHQWFGNLVSPKWWKYIWLNEGFATYFEYFITHELRQDWRLNETFVVNAMQLNAFVADAAKDVRPMNHDASSPQEISRLFDSIAYQKAGSVIRMMSHILTPPVFQKGLQNYLTKMKLQNADSEDLLSVLEQASNALYEDVKLRTVMDNWVNKPGYPVVTVKKVDNQKYEVTQERFTLGNRSENKLENDTKWWVPLTYVKQSNLNFGNTTPVAWLEANNKTLTLNIGEKDKWIIFNTQQTGYYRVNYDEENWKLLKNFLHSKNFEQIPVINRAQLVDDALNMARTNRLNYTVALPLTLYLKQEKDYVPWQTALTNLNFLRNMLRTSKHYHIFNLYITHIMQKLTESVGYAPKKGDDDLTKILRVNAMKWACRAEIGSCTSYANQEFKEWINNSSKILDVDLKNNILCAGVRNADLKVWNTIYTRLVESTKDEDERKSLVSLLACSKSEDILRTHLLQTISSKNYTATFDSAAQSIISEYPGGVNIVLNVLINNYTEIQKLNNAEAMIKSTAEAIANAITEEEQFTKMAKFLAVRLEEKPLHNVLSKASENLAWLERNRGTIENWLVEYEAELSVVSSASSVAFASILVVLSLFITQFY
ncbi:unnamed protein product [Xylocopa violacea]